MKSGYTASLKNSVGDLIVDTMDKKEITVTGLGDELHLALRYKNGSSCMVFLTNLRGGYGWPVVGSSDPNLFPQRLSIVLNRLEIPETKPIISRLQKAFGDAFQYPPKHNSIESFDSDRQREHLLRFYEGLVDKFDGVPENFPKVNQSHLDVIEECKGNLELAISRLREEIKGVE